MPRSIILALCFAAGPAFAAEPVDADGDPLPPGAVRRYGSTRFRTAGSPHDLSYSPDGKLLAAATPEGVLIWDRATGKRLHVLLGHKSGPTALAFTPDGKRLLSVDRELITWDVATGRLVSRLSLTDQREDPRAFSPDRKQVAMVEIFPKGTTIQVYDLTRPKKLLERLEGFETAVTDVAWSRDGKHIASLEEEGLLKIWDAASFRLLREFRCEEGRFHCLAWSPDGKRIVTGESGKLSGRIRVRDAETGNEAMKLDGGDDTGAQQQKICLTADGKRLVVLTYHGIRVWDVVNGKKLREVDFKENSSASRMCVAPDGNEVVVDNGLNLVQRYDLATGRLLSPASGPEGRVRAVAVSPDGDRLVTAGTDAHVRTWSTKTGQETRSFAVSETDTESIVLSADGRRAVDNGSDALLTVWDTTTGKKLRSLEGNFQLLGSRALNSDGRYCAAHVGLDVFAVWDTTTGAVPELVRYGQREVDEIRFSPDGRKLALLGGDVGRAPGVEVWDWRRRKRCSAISEAKLYPYRAIFSPDGRELAVPHGAGIRVVELASGKVVLDREFKATVTALAFSPDGRVLAWGIDEPGSRSRMALLDLATGKALPALAMDLGSVMSLAFAPDGRHLYGGCDDTTTLCWKMPNLTAISAPSADMIPGLVKKLCGEDAGAARQARWALARGPAEVVAEIRRELGRRTLPDTTRINKLIADLDGTKYDARTAAARELAGLGYAVEAALHKARAETKSANLRRELDRLMERLDGPVAHLDTLAALRMIAVLEEIASPAALEMLRELSKGDANSVIARDATAALARLEASKPGRK